MKGFPPFSLTPSADHIKAVQDTSGVILICDNDVDCEPQRKGYPIFAEYSRGHKGEYTKAWDYLNAPKHGYLAQIWDPIATSGGGHVTILAW